MLKDFYPIFVLIIFHYLPNCAGEFKIPTVTLQAFKPKGFKASIPASKGIQLFEFHGNVNKPLLQVDNGDYQKNTATAENNQFTYFNPDLQLKPGDEINYWIFIQYDKLGYRLDNRTWKVEELVDVQETNCELSKSVVSGKSQVCQGSVILEDAFTSIDNKSWNLQQYIPQAPDFEYVSYQKVSDVSFSLGNKLYVKPKIVETPEDTRKNLDLRDGCTRTNPEECFFEYLGGAFIAPPIVSAKLVSTVSFRFGKIEIKAKLPAGDWIYPEIYLERVSNPVQKIVLAYSRGNDKLIGTSNDDIGSRLLFGGLINDPSEPSRSTYLKSKRSEQPFYANFHTYLLNWTEDEIELFLDGVRYGTISESEINNAGFADGDLFKIVIGVGVGGIHDFPDNYKSGAKVKPWKNIERNQMKKFFIQRSDWEDSWATDDLALQIESVKVWAL